MTAGEHEPVPARPVGGGRIEAQEAAPEDVGGGGETERRSGVAGAGALDHVDGEEAQGVDGQAIAVHELVRGSGRWRCDGFARV